MLLWKKTGGGFIHMSVGNIIWQPRNHHLYSAIVFQTYVFPLQSAVVATFIEKNTAAVIKRYWRQFVCWSTAPCCSDNRCVITLRWSAGGLYILQLLESLFYSAETDRQTSSMQNKRSLDIGLLPLREPPLCMLLTIMKTNGVSCGLWK